MTTNSIFNQLSMTHAQLDLMLKIRRKGRDEQEKNLLFPSIYKYKAVTKNTWGYWINGIPLTKMICPR